MKLSKIFKVEHFVGQCSTADNVMRIAQDVYEKHMRNDGIRISGFNDKEEYGATDWQMGSYLTEDSDTHQSIMLPPVEITDSDIKSEAILSREKKACEHEPDDKIFHPSAGYNGGPVRLSVQDVTCRHCGVKLKPSAWVIHNDNDELPTSEKARLPEMHGTLHHYNEEVIRMQINAIIKYLRERE